MIDISSGDRVEIVDDNQLIGLTRISKHYKNGEICEVVDFFYGLVSLRLVNKPNVSNILISAPELKAFKKL